MKELQRETSETYSHGHRVDVPMILRLNSTGPEVRILQAALLAAGFDPNGADGGFGVDTEAAVKRFQSAHGLTVDGIAGPGTLAALETVSSQPVPDAAVAFTAPFEGYRAKPYRDSGGVWTIGYGSTRDATGAPVTSATAPVTLLQATGLMRRDLTAALTVVSHDVRVPLTDPERVALMDFIYNVGEGNFEASTLLRKLNAGDLAGASLEFLKWNHAGGKVLAGLSRRREAERAEFNKSSPGATK